VPDFHRLDPVADDVFLRAGVADPLSRVAFRPTNTVVRCATCGLVSLRETWEAVGGCPNGHAASAPWDPRAALLAAGDGSVGRTPPPVAAAVPAREPLRVEEPRKRPAWLLPLLGVLGVALLLIAGIFLSRLLTNNDPVEVVEGGPAQTGPRAVAALAGEIEGMLDDTDYRGPDGRYQDLYTFAADSSGRVLSFVVESEDFFPDLVVELPDGSRVESETLSSEAGDGVGTGLRRVAVRNLRGPGLYRVFLTTRQPQATGAYVLRIAQEDPVRTLTANASAFAAELGAFSQQVDGFYRDTYQFRGAAGREHVITVRSSAFAPTVLVTGSPAAERGESGRAGGSITYTVTPDRSGTHTVVVSSRERAKRGAYTVQLAVEAPPPQAEGPAEATAPAAGALRPNAAPLRDSLATGDSRAYTFRGRVGDRVTLDLRSEGFTPTLVLVGPDGQRTPAEPDGDRARVRATLTSEGTYRVLVGSAGGGGLFSVSLGQQAAVTAAPIPRLPGQGLPARPATPPSDTPTDPPGDYQPQPIGDDGRQQPGDRVPGDPNTPFLPYLPE
jgi:hypothetical protein